MDLGSREPNPEPEHVETYLEWYERTLIATAAHDLVCPAPSLTRSHADLLVGPPSRWPHTVTLDLVEGCGLRATYTMRCHSTNDERRSCQHVILSRVEIPR